MFTQRRAIAHVWYDDLERTMQFLSSGIGDLQSLSTIVPYFQRNPTNRRRDLEDLRSLSTGCTQFGKATPEQL